MYVGMSSGALVWDAFYPRRENLATIHARQLASIAGNIISVDLAVGQLQSSGQGACTVYSTLGSHGRTCLKSASVRDKLTFWRCCSDKINGQMVWRSPGVVRIFYSDVSCTGYAGYLVEHGSHVAHGQWNMQENGKSSTWRELAEVDRVPTQSSE